MNIVYYISTPYLACNIKKKTIKISNNGIKCSFDIF